MGKPAILSVKVMAEAKEAIKELDGFGGALNRLDDKTAKARLAMTGASAGVVAIGKSSVEAASLLEQSTGAVESVFKDQAQQINAMAEAAAEANGLSTRSYQEFATLIGSQLKGLGIEQDQIVGKTSDLINIGSDLAATFGGSTADAVSALSSLMRGEADPIERYGVSIKQSDVNARMAAEGLDKLDGEARRQAETQTRLKMVMEATADAHGAFSREANTAAGQQERASAAWENARASLGQALLPAVTSVAIKLKDLAGIVAAHPRAFQLIGGAIVTVTGALWAISAAAKHYKNMVAAARAAQVLFNLALTANPIGLVVAALAAVAAALVVAYKKSETFRNKVNEVGDNVRAAFERAGERIEAIKERFENAKNAAKQKFDEIKNAATELGQKITQSFKEAGEKISAAWEGVKKFFSAVFQALTNYVNSHMKVYKALADAVMHPGETIKRVFDAIKAAIDNVTNAIKNAISWFGELVSKISNFSPGNLVSSVTSAMFAAAPPDMLGVPGTNLLTLIGVPPAPELTAATASGYLPGTIGTLTAAARPIRGTTINITVNGALDAEGVARQIKDILSREEMRQSW